MITRCSYLLVTLCTLLIAHTSYAQSGGCEKNMLVIPDQQSYAAIPNPKNLSLPGAFTIEFWAQSKSFLPHAGLLEQVGKGDTGAFSIGFTSGDSLVVTLTFTGGTTTYTTPNIPNIQDWQHYALTFTPNDSVRIYINGIIQTTTKTSATRLALTSDSILIGHSDLSAVTFTGNIDEVRFWNVARTSSTILSSMYSSLTGKETGLAAYYSFDDDPTSPIFHDFTSRGDEGVMLSSAVLTASTSPITGPATSGYMLASKELSVHFSDLVCGNSADTIVHIYNRGPEQVTIDPVAFQIGTTFSAATTGFPLPADSTHFGIVHIHAAPTKPGLYRDTLIIPSTTICGGILRIPVELQFDTIGLAFEDTTFSLQFAGKDLLPCDLPRPSQTLLRNTGTRSVTINALKFSSPGDIIITSPAIPFTIAKGRTQVITFTVQPGPSGAINTTLKATANECTSSAKITFHGQRIIPQFDIPAFVSFPTIHLPATSINIFDTIYLKNTGTATLSLSPNLTILGGPGFQLLSPPAGLAVIKPDSILAIRILFKTTECGTFVGAVHFQDQFDCGIDTLIPLSITVLGPDVSAASGVIDMGASCGGHDTIIALVNRSGRMVTIGKAVLDHDSVISITNPALPRTLQPGDSVRLTIHFAPAEPGPSQVIARFPLSPCGDAYLQIRGLLGVGTIVLSDSSLNFGNGCDLSPALQKLTITNLCGRQITISSTSLEGSQNYSLVSPQMPFTIGNNQSKDITIRFSPQQLGILESARMTLFDSGCFVTRFQLKGVRERANYVWKPAFAEFGTVCPGRMDTVTVSLQNLGFGDDTILSYRVIPNANAFSAPGMNGSVIMHGSSKLFQVVFSPGDTGEFAGAIEVVLGPCHDTTLFALHGIGGPAATLSLNPSVIDFGTIKLGTTDSLCTILQNPSCIPMRITQDSIHFAPSQFALTASSLANFPDSISGADPLSICFSFTPTKIGSFETQDTIRIGSQKQIVTLRGKAGISDLKIKPRSIDFGDVLRGTTSSPIQISIQNIGSYPATLTTVSNPSADFTQMPDTHTVGGNSFVTLQMSFTPSQLGLQTTSLVLQWGDSVVTIQLRGKGIQPGLALPSSLVDFSKVRVAHDSIISIWVKNTLPSDPINVTSVSIGGKFSVSPLGSASVFQGDSLKYSITYLPDAEISDSSTLILHTNVSGDAYLPVRGEGVEAHLRVDTNFIDFGDVGLGLVRTMPLLISNTGGYPLALLSISNKLSVFSSSTGGVLIVPPDSAILCSVRFAPLRATLYRDSLSISADAPEKNALVAISGNGVFAPLGVPQVSYSIPDRLAKVGDILEIPISIGGKDLPLFNMDSFRIDLSYDPAVIFFHDSIATQNMLASGYQMSFTRMAHDSIICIRGAGKDTIPVAGRFFSLFAEALLGPRDSTRMFILSSQPQNTADLLSSSGEFVVTDCENYRGGIIAKGNYSVAHITPNPVTSSARIEYEIGLPGMVHIDLYDALGRHIRTITSDNQTKGAHTAIFSTDGIPSGEYIYVLRSLEYENRGSVIITK